MTLSEIKINIQKQETKDEPWTNGSYKIKQIIIKIMKYTHIHILRKVKTVQQKQSTIDWPGKQRKLKKLYLPAENKTKPQHGKTKLKEGVKWRIQQWKQN